MKPAAGRNAELQEVSAAKVAEILGAFPAPATAVAKEPSPAKPSQESADQCELSPPQSPPINLIHTMKIRTLSKLLPVMGIASAMTFPVATAAFVNGDFESGAFTGWTKAGGLWEESPQNSGNVVIFSNVDPNVSAIIHDAGGTAGATVFDPNTNGNLAEVLQGNYSARLNDQTNGYHFSTLSQTVTNYTANNMYFGFAAVLQEPSNEHPEAAAPHFSFNIYDVTTSTTLYNIAFNVYNAAASGMAWHNGYTDGNGTWKYSDWNIIHVDTSALSGLNGDTFQVQVAAYDCGWGGHGGYAYVDSFQPTLPDPNPGITPNVINANEITSVPEPASMLATAVLLAGGLQLRRRR